MISSQKSRVFNFQSISIENDFLSHHFDLWIYELPRKIRLNIIFLNFFIVLNFNQLYDIKFKYKNTKPTKKKYCNGNEVRTTTDLANVFWTFYINFRGNSNNKLNEIS